LIHITKFEFSLIGLSLIDIKLKLDLVDLFNFYDNNLALIRFYKLILLNLTLT